jgi:hypothetical protein
MRMLQLKLILLFRSVPDDDVEFRQLLERFGFIERFTPYVHGWPTIRKDEAKKWLEDRRNEAIAEMTLLVSTVAMVAAIAAMVAAIMPQRASRALTRAAASLVC